MKDTCIIYRDFRNAVRNFSPQQRAAFYEMIMDYVMDDIEPPPQSEFISHFELIRSRIDNDITRYKTSVENGKKGGAPKGNQNAKKNKQKQPKTSKNNLNVNVNDNVNVNVCVTARAREFCAKYNIAVDTPKDTHTENLDFDALDKAYSKSAKFLQKSPASKCLSFIIKNYASIIAGKYEDVGGGSSLIVSDTAADELNAMFAESNKIL